MISIRRLAVDDWPVWRQLRRDALREAPTAFGSTLAEWSGAGDTESRWRHRLETVPVNLVAAMDEILVGMVSLTAVEAQEAEIISMWIAPTARGQGVSDALLRAVLDRARAAGALSVALDVAAGNERAIRLYTRAGFVDVGLATDPQDPKPERRMRLCLDAPPQPGRS